MKRTRLSKKGKSITSILQKEGDKLIQQIGKLKWPQSIVSGQPTEVIHHFVTKATSNALRYAWDNLCPLTNGEHFSHHRKDDPHIHGTIIQVRGTKWHNTLLARRWRETVHTDKEYYLKVIERLNKEKELLIKDLDSQ